MSSKQSFSDLLYRADLARLREEVENTRRLSGQLSNLVGKLEDDLESARREIRRLRARGRS